jgi:hypothetical protein
MAVGRDMNVALDHSRKALKRWQAIHDHPKTDGFQLASRACRSSDTSWSPAGVGT